MHQIDADGQAVLKREMLRMLSEHGSIRAWDDVSELITSPPTEPTVVVSISSPTTDESLSFRNPVLKSLEDEFCAELQDARWMGYADVQE